MISSKKDPAVNYDMVTQPLWKMLIENNSNPENCRLSSFDKVTEPAGNAASDNHHMAKTVTYDLHMLDGSTYPDLETIDGNGNTVKLDSPNGIIYWMNSVSSATAETSSILKPVKWNILTVICLMREYSMTQ